ncbi:hypothetical protein HG536_0A03660 [Torulaspora globosa]|uniref:DUF159-domain-containing protein n=1 Tax=Torulaspora globosa TaxID=48254 RepID=A0A7G3ZAL2_9SACH|nr:uncharacterized protein HG536_0A03660 [Torulaspora globosa]QLL30548.1 hypothetical protein HG536_0A03660 [Torulaspora globosa]
MCGRYAIAYSSEELPSHFQSQHLPVTPQLAKGEHHDRSYNVAPTSDGAVYRAKDHELRYMKWGLIPHWTKSVKDFKTYKTFNARVENLLESRMWAQCCKNKRCVIPLNGYYEWVTKGKKKIPYYVVRSDGKLAFVAGLYDYLESEDLWTYAVITAKAPKELTWLHTRMPVLLEPGSEAWETWMNPDKTDWTQEELDELLAANYDDKMLSVYQVSEEVNKVGSSSESMVKPIFKEDSGKFNLERFPEEEEHGGAAEGEPETKRFKAEAKEPESGKGLSGKIGGGYDVKKERRGRMVGPDQEEDLEIPETAVAGENAEEIEEAFVRDEEDVDLEEEYLKQSEDEEVEEGDLENVAGEDDEEYVEGGDDNEAGSDYEVVQEGEKEEDRAAGESIGERVKNEDTARAEEGNLSKADVRKEQRSRKNKTSATAKGDTGESSSKWGSMTASEAGRKGGTRSSRRGNTRGAQEEEEGEEEDTSGRRGRGNFGKGDTGEQSSRWGSMTASEAGRKGGRKSSRSGNTGGAEGEEGEEEASGRKGSGNYGKGDTGEHSARWGSMTASEAGRKGGRKSSRSGNTGGAEGEEGEEEASGRKGSGNYGKGDTGEHSARWGSMTASEAGKKGGRKSSRSGNTGGAGEEEEGEGEETSGHKGRGNFGKGDTGEHSARWGSMTASEAGKKGGRTRKQHT